MPHVACVDFLCRVNVIPRYAPRVVSSEITWEYVGRKLRCGAPFGQISPVCSDSESFISQPDCVTVHWSMSLSAPNPISASKGQFDIFFLVIITVWD